MYEVSDTGQVRSWKKIRGRGRGKGLAVVRAETPRAMRLQYGYYPRVTLSGVPQLVHRLVLAAFVGPCPKGSLCRHLNGDPHDNRLQNLAWGSPTENHADKRRHGTLPLGTQVHNAKLNETKVRAIRNSATPRQKLADRYGVSLQCIEAVIGRRNWKHI